MIKDHHKYEGTVDVTPERANYLQRVGVAKKNKDADEDPVDEFEKVEKKPVKEKVERKPVKEKAEKTK